MPLGPGKYDAEVTSLRKRLEADGVVLLVFKGNRGSGFSAQLTLDLTLKMPQLLRAMADEMDRSRGMLGQ